MIKIIEIIYIDMRKIKILNTSFANFGSITNILKLIGHESELIEDLKNINGKIIKMLEISKNEVIIRKI